MSNAVPTRRVYLAHPVPGTSTGLLVRHRVRLGPGLRPELPAQLPEYREQISSAAHTPPPENNRQFLADALAWLLGFDLDAMLALVLGR
ncbi:hypothetical protein [Hymenobacter sp. UYCo722]|uniref:hypothetical protein n=1 Tax=Hymenobacter sp. UYCo722 TaxID=3156335 RepID=UPI0033997ACE